jgi:hypothetical protein
MREIKLSTSLNRFGFGPIIRERVAPGAKAHSREHPSRTLRF